MFFLVDFSHFSSRFLKAAPRQSKCSSKKRRIAVITATPEKNTLEKLNSIRRTKVRTQKKAKKRFCCHHHHQLRKSGYALCVVAVTQIQHQVNPGFNVASVKDGHIMDAAVLTWPIFVKTVLKTIKIEQYLIGE